MTGSELATFTTEVNGGASIGSTFFFQLFNICRTLVEQRRPWMMLRYTDTSKSVTAANTANRNRSLLWICRPFLSSG
jgi:hypothetical protein